MTLGRLLDWPAPCRPRPANDNPLASKRNDAGLSGLIPITQPIADIRKHRAVGKLSQSVEIDVWVCERVNIDHDSSLFRMSRFEFIVAEERLVCLLQGARSPPACTIMFRPLSFISVSLSPPCCRVDQYTGQPRV